MMIFLFSGVIVGGQMLARISDHLTPTHGIVIISLVSLVVSSITPLIRLTHFSDA
jgi:hypothetical protein